MTVYLHPNQPDQFSLYSSATPYKPAQNSPQTRHLWTDENATPLQNGSPSDSKLHKFVPRNPAPTMTIMHDALKRGDGVKAWKCIQANMRFPFIEQRESKLVLAIRNCSIHPVLIEHLITCAHQDAINHTTDTNALIEAAKLLNEKLVQRLLEKGANPNQHTTLQTTPLGCAIRVGGTIESGRSESVAEQIQINNDKLFSVVQILLQHKASVNTVDPSGYTPLQALFNKMLPQQITPSLVSLLIANGADVEDVSWEDPSPENVPAIEKAVEEGLVLNAGRIEKLTNSDDQATTFHFERLLG